MPSRTTAIWTGATGAVIVVAGAAAAYWTHPSLLWPVPPPAATAGASVALPLPAAVAPAVAAAATTASTAPPPATMAPPPPAAVKPAFDVVNVDPAGEAVVAGRAAPNAKVELRDDGKTVAEATANSEGQFVIIPPALAPGSHSLTLAAPGISAAQTSNPIEVAVAAPNRSPSPPSRPWPRPLRRLRQGRRRPSTRRPDRRIASRSSPSRPALAAGSSPRAPPRPTRPCGSTSAGLSSATRRPAPTAAGR